MSTLEKPSFGGWTCPAPLRNYPTVVLGHGSGGKMMTDLIQHLFVPALHNDLLSQMADATVLEFGTNNHPLKLAFTTDSFVISPLVFPGGDIGELAVNGTVNDLAMSGGRPLYLSAGFILEEGLPMDVLARIAASFARACDKAGVQLVAGNTKVVGRGHGDGLYINTTGIGVVPAHVAIGPTHAQPGDAVIVSGTVGDHGIAIMSVREGLEFDAQIESDTAPLTGLVEAMLEVSSESIHCLRDATRGGLAATLNELATSSKVGIEFDERKVPVTAAVHAACEMLGLDPFYTANEGKLVAIVSAEDSDAVLTAMRANPLGRSAVSIGQVTADHPGLVVARTGIGSTRVVDLPAGELLPRIC